MKKIILIFTVLLTTATFAQNKNAKASIEVDGVCMMCKDRIEKAAIRTKGVKSAVWNVDTHELKLIYDERKTDLKTISAKIASVGHDTKEIKATDEQYDSVHPCCKYRDKDVVKDHEGGKKADSKN
jgi:copper chaperone CopZ